MIKKILTAAVLVSLTACSNNTETVQNEDYRSPVSIQLQELEDSVYVSPLPDTAPTYTVAMTGSDIPYNVTNVHGHIEGIEVDILRAAGEKAGFKVEFFQNDLDALLPNVIAGHYDLGMSIYTDTPARRQNYSVSDPYYQSYQVIVWNNPALDIVNKNSLAGLTVATENDSYPNNELPGIGATVRNNPSAYLTFAGLFKDGVDAAVVDVVSAEYFLEHMKEGAENIRMVHYDPDQKSDDLVILAPDTPEGQHKIEQINNGLAQIKADGTIAEIQKKWIH